MAFSLSDCLGASLSL